MLSTKAKIALVLIGALCLVHLTTAASLVRERRDEEEVKKAASDTIDTLDKTLDSWKKGVEDLFKDGIQVDKIVDSIQKNFKEIGDKVEAASKDFAQSVSKKAEELTNKAKE